MIELPPSDAGGSQLSLSEVVVVLDIDSDRGVDGSVGRKQSSPLSLIVQVKLSIMLCLSASALQ